MMKKTMTILALSLCPWGMAVQAQDDLAKAFATPPAEARPWVYCLALSGNLTKEGITADFEAMARVGIGGLILMDVDQGVPPGKAAFAGPLWMEVFTHACREAKRLGLEINMNNDAGWCGSGGPWITPERLKQSGTLVVWSTDEFARTDEIPAPYRSALGSGAPLFGTMVLPLGRGKLKAYGWAMIAPDGVQLPAAAPPAPK